MSARRTWTNPARRGFSVVEVTISIAVLGGLLIVAGYVLRASGNLAQTSADEGAAADRLQDCLLPVANEVRNASFATLQSLDGTPFSDGETDVGIRLRRVTGFAGVPELGSPAVIRWTRPAGAPWGDVTIDRDGVWRVLARQVTDFQVSRTGEALTIRATARSGPADDSGRSQSGRVVVRARNP